MTIQDSIANRVSEMLEDYYPEDKFSVHSINRVTTKPGNSVYRIKIFDKFRGYRDLYAKEHPKKVASNINEIMGLKYNRGHLLMPRILDYYDEENIILSEGVKGDTLTKSLLNHGFSFGMILSADTLLSCSRKIGHAIGSLQNLTSRGRKRRIRDLDIYLIREIESEDYFETILKKELLKDIRAQVESLKGVVTRVAQCHGDLSPHNIIMKDDQVFLIDFSFQDNATFMDPSLHLVSLELMRSRFGFFMKNTVSIMEFVFMDTYSDITKESWEPWAWAIIKTLTYLRFLLTYSKRKKNPMNALVASIDRRYLLKKIRES